MWNVLAEIERDENHRVTAGMIESDFNPQNSNERFPEGHPAQGQLMWRPCAPRLMFRRLCKLPISPLKDERGTPIRVNGKPQWVKNPEYKYWVVVPEGMEGIMLCQELLEEYRAVKE